MGTAAFAAGQWAMVIALARLQSRSDVGVYGLGLALATPVLLLSNLQLRTVLATDVEQRFSFRDYLSARTSTTLLAGLLLAVFVLLRGDADLSVRALLLVVASKMIEAISDVCYGLFQFRERMDCIATSQLIRGIGGACVFTLLLLGGLRLDGALAGVVLLWLGTLIAHDLPRAVRLAPKIPSAGIVSMLQIAKTAWPLGLTVALIALSANAPRIFLDYHFSAAALGGYVAVAYFYVAIGLISLSLGQALTPRLSRYWHAGQRHDFRALIRLMLLGCLLVTGLATLVAYFIGATLLTIVFGPEYAAHDDLLLLVLLASGGSAAANIMNHAASATRAFHRFVLPSVATAIVTLILCYWLIPWGGVLGAGWVLLATSWIGVVPPLLVLHGAFATAPAPADVEPSSPAANDAARPE